MNSLVRIATSVSIVIGGLTAGSARADAASVINLAGFGEGCFNCTSAELQGSAVIGGLTFDAGTFSITTDATGAALADLGTFTLASTPFNYSNSDTDFLLGITFTVPTGLSAGEYTAEVAGSINAAGNGAVNIQFDHAFQTFVFTNAQATGSFEVGIADPNLHLQFGDTGSVFGSIRNAQLTSTPVLDDTVSIPEPASVLLLATGIGAALRRRLVSHRKSQPQH